MKRKSIVVKLFIITTVMFILFLGTAMVSQTLFFEKFYIEQKKEKLKNAVENFSITYKDNLDHLDSLNKMINNFVDQNNAQIAILDENGLAKYFNTYEILVETEEKLKVHVTLNNIAFVDELQALKLSVGTYIWASGAYFDKDYKTFTPMRIESNGKIWEALKDNILIKDAALEGFFQPAPEPLQVPGKLIKTEIMKPMEGKISIGTSAKVIEVQKHKLKGKIVELNMPTQLQLLEPYRRSMLWSAVDNWFWTLKTGNFQIKTDKIITYQYKYPSSGENSMVFIQPVMQNGKLKEAIFVMASLQPVGEAVSAMKDYYIYVFLAAVLFIIMMSFIYSKMIAKPLLNINDAALRMANLDFSVQCKINRNDEIGSLAESINILSKNLRCSLDELMAANQQLQKDIEKERALESMRKQFVSSVSHELKTPLSIIKAYAEGLKDGVSEKKKDHYVDIILDETGKMDHLVLDMLDLSKLESKLYTLKIEHFSIHDLVMMTIARLDNHIAEKTIEIKYHIEEYDYDVNADMKRMEQVISNLLTNAIRHTPPQGFIDMTLKRQDNSVYISIENNGEHIPESCLNQVWDRFYRVEESRSRHSGGTGLGLSIVKNILDLHNSIYGVKNTPEGVLFYFTIPLNRDNTEST